MNSQPSIEEYETRKEKQMKDLQKDILILLSNIQHHIRITGIPYLIHLCHFEILEKVAIKIQANKNDKARKNLTAIYHLINQIFPKYFQHISVRAGEMIRKLINDKQNYEEKAIPSADRNKKWLELFNQFIQIKQPFNIHRYNKFLEEKIFQFEISDQKAEEYVCMNWLKAKLQQLRNATNATEICCRLIFFDQMKILAAEGRNTQYKKYFWPITSPNIKFHLKKTIVGFLNAFGGIIYIGIQEDKEKQNTVASMEIKENKKLDIYKFFKELVDENINPKHVGFNVREGNIYVNDYKRIPINEYISLQIMPVINEKTLLPCQKNEKNESKYIIKIFVKIGHPKHYYYLITNDHSIDFFVRDDRNVEKKQFQNAYQQIYKRLNAFEKYKAKNKDKKENQPKDTSDLQKRDTFHDDCRYKMDGINLDIDSDSDEQTF